MDAEKNVLLCPVCMQSYNDARVPIILPCGHTFCTTCVKTLEATDNKTCSTCRQQFTQTSVNYGLRDVLPLVLRAQQQRKRKSRWDSKPGEDQAASEEGQMTSPTKHLKLDDAELELVGMLDKGNFIGALELLDFLLFDRRSEKQLSRRLRLAIVLFMALGEPVAAATCARACRQWVLAEMNDIRFVPILDSWIAVQNTVRRNGSGRRGRAAKAPCSLESDDDKAGKDSNALEADPVAATPERAADVFLYARGEDRVSMPQRRGSSPLAPFDFTKEQVHESEMMLHTWFLNAYHFCHTSHELDRALEAVDGILCFIGEVKYAQKCSAGTVKQHTELELFATLAQHLRCQIKFAQRSLSSEDITDAVKWLFWNTRRFGLTHHPFNLCWFDFFGRLAEHDAQKTLAFKPDLHDLLDGAQNWQQAFKKTRHDCFRRFAFLTFQHPILGTVKDGLVTSSADWLEDDSDRSDDKTAEDFFANLWLENHLTSDYLDCQDIPPTLLLQALVNYARPFDPVTVGQAQTMLLQNALVYFHRDALPVDFVHYPRIPWASLDSAVFTHDVIQCLVRKLGTRNLFLVKNCFECGSQLLWSGLRRRCSTCVRLHAINEQQQQQELQQTQDLQAETTNFCVAGEVNGWSMFALTDGRMHRVMRRPDAHNYLAWQSVELNHMRWVASATHLSPNLIYYEEDMDTKRVMWQELKGALDVRAIIFEQAALFLFTPSIIRSRVWDPKLFHYGLHTFHVECPDLHFFTVNALNGQIILVGGENVSRLSNGVRVYDHLTDTWREGPALPDARSQHGSAVFKNELYIAGGVTHKFSDKNVLGLPAYSRRVLSFDGLKWRNVGEMAQGKLFPTIGQTVYRGKPCLVILGGFDQQGSSDMLEILVDDYFIQLKSPYPIGKVVGLS
jgi:hypothetical protein